MNYMTNFLSNSRNTKDAATPDIHRKHKSHETCFPQPYLNSGLTPEATHYNEYEKTALYRTRSIS